MRKAVSQVLGNFQAGLTETLLKLEEFLDNRNVETLKEAVNMMGGLAAIHRVEFAEISHSVLPGTVFEASVMMSERIAKIEENGLAEADVEYVREIYELFRFIADKIETGEYEAELNKMQEKRKASHN